MVESGVTYWKVSERQKSEEIEEFRKHFIGRIHERFRGKKGRGSNPSPTPTEALSYFFLQTNQTSVGSRRSKGSGTLDPYPTPSLFRVDTSEQEKSTKDDEGIHPTGN